MTNVIKVGMEVSDNGTLTAVNNKAKEVTSSFKAMQRAAKDSAGVAGGGVGASAFQENIDYRNARGVAGTGTGGSRDFAKQAQGLGGLVHLYATFAANIFAVTAAFQALDSAMQYEQMIKGAEALEASTGAALRSISAEMVKVSDGALSMKEALKYTSLASSAGISAKTIGELTRGAKGAALALGRDMGDAIDRVIRGTAKLEPELLDELGVTVKAQAAYKAYAQQMNIAVDSMTGYQKTAAFTIAVNEELSRKFGDVADKVSASPFNKFVGELKNTGTELLNLVNGVITPVISALADHVELMYAGILLTVKSLATKAIPEIGKLFAVDPAILRTRKAALDGLLGDIKEANSSELRLALEHKDALIAAEKAYIAEKKKLDVERINELSSQAFSNPKGQTAKNLAEASSVQGINSDTKLRSGVTAALGRTESSLGAMGMAGQVNTKLYHDTEARRVALVEIDKILKSHAATNGIIADSEAYILSIEQQKLLVIEEQEAQQLVKINLSKAEHDALKLNLQYQKLARDEAVQSTLYTKGAQAAELERAKQQLLVDQARYDLAKNKALLGKVVDKPLQGPVRPGDSPLGSEKIKETTLLGDAYVLLGNKLDGVKAKAIALGGALSTAFGWISIIGIALYTLYTVTKSLLDANDMLNKYTSDLNNSLKDNENVLHTATAAYTKYTDLLTQAPYSIQATIDANSIAANTFDQVTESIDKQVQAYKVWQNNQTTLSAWWDQAFGTSSFDKLKENLAKDIAAASKYAPDLKDNLSGMSTEVANTDSIVRITEITDKFSKMMFKASETLKTQNGELKDLKSSFAEAGTAMDAFNKKELIKNENLRKVVEVLDKLKNTKDFNIQLKTISESIPDSILSQFAPQLKDIISAQKEIEENEKRIVELKNEAAQLEKERSLTKVNVEQSIYDKIDSLINKSGEFIGYYFAKFGLALVNGIIGILHSIKEGLDKAANSLAKSIFDIFKNGPTVKGITEAFLNMLKLAIPGVPAIISFLQGARKGASKAGAEDAVARAKASTTDKGSPAAILAAKAAENEKKLKEAQAKQAAAKAKQGDLSQAKLNTLVGNEMGRLAAKDVKENSAGNSLRKEQLSAELALIKAQSAEQQVINKLEEQRKGYISESNIEQDFTLKIKEAEKQHSIEELDLNLKLQKSLKDTKMTEAQRKDLVEKSTEAFNQEYETKLRTLDIDKKRQILAESIKEYTATIKVFQEESLALASAQLALDKESGVVSAEEAISREAGLTITKLEIEKQAILNKLKKEGIINPEQQKGAAEATDAASMAALRKNEQEQQAARNMEQAKLDANERTKTEKGYQNRINAIQSVMDQEADAGKVSLKALHSRMDAEDDLYKFKRAALEKIHDQEAINALDIENQNRLYREQKELLEANKKNFYSLDMSDKMATIAGEAKRQADEFRKSMKDTVTGTFDAIYSGMDAAIDELTTKWMNSEKFSIKDIITTFRNTAAEEFRKMAADQMKLQVREGVSWIMDQFGIKAPQTAQEKFQDDLLSTEKKSMALLAKIASGTSNIAGTDLTDIKNIDIPNVLEKTAEENQVIFGKMIDESYVHLDEATEDWVYNSTGKIDELGKTSGSMFDSISGKFGDIFGSNGILMTLLSSVGSGISSIFTSIGSMFSGSGSGSSGGGIFGSLFSSIGGMFGGGGEGGGFTDFMSGITATDWASGAASTFTGLIPGFANGGIMSQYGALSLNKYANGGIANSPQLALFGEGRMNEAYVPLPDGRSIPVTMQGPSSQTTSTSGAPINISVNVNMQTGSSDVQTSGTSSQDARQLGQLISMKVKEEIVNQQRSGGLLNKRT